MNKKMISLRLSESMLADMATCCSVYQINRTSLVERAVREFMVSWWEREGETILEIEKYREQKKRQHDTSWF